MKFTRVLHPETVQGLRGHKDRIYQYTQSFKHISRDEKGNWGCTTNDNRLLAFFKGNLQNLILPYKARHGIKTYHVGSEFLKELKTLKTDIPADLLPSKLFCYVSFPDASVFDKDGDEIEGCYVFIGPRSETILPPNNRPDVLNLWMSYIIKRENEEDKLPPTGYFLRQLDTYKTLSPLVGKSSYVNFGPTGEQTEIDAKEPFWLLMFNIILYIHSPESDLLRLKNRSATTSKEFAKQTKDSGVENLCSIPVTLVSWNYQKPILYTKDSTWVGSHLRWQRYGSENSLLKLIWIKPHERKFKNIADDATMTSLEQ